MLSRLHSIRLIKEVTTLSWFNEQCGVTVDLLDKIKMPNYVLIRRV